MDSEFGFAVATIFLLFALGFTEVLRLDVFLTVRRTLLCGTSDSGAISKSLVIQVVSAYAPDDVPAKISTSATKANHVPFIYYSGK